MTRPRISYFSAALVALASAAIGCKTNGGAAANDPADASVTFQSSIVTTPATWNSLYGSWPEARFDHGMVYDSDLKRIVVFGGRQADSGPHFGDLWEWDTTKGSWNQRTPGGCVAPARCPYDRSQPAMFYDPVRKKTVMFSGWQPGAGFYHPDQWEFDGAAQTWTERVNTTQPTARFGASVVWDSMRGRAVLFGGFDETTGRLNDTWEWDGSNWSSVTTTGTKPTPRHSAKMAFDASRGKTILYSGNTGSGLPTAGTWVDEVYEYDGVAGTWTKITASNINGYQYYYGYSSMAYDAGRSKIVLYYHQTYVWEYNPGTGTTGSWTDATPTPTKVDTSYPPQNQAGMVYDAGRQVLAVFGGRSYSRGLWELNGNGWTWTNRSAPANGPIQRQYPSMAFDSMRGKLMVFGGRSSVDSLFKQDIWEWSGTDATLTNRTTGGTKPDARYQAGMCYDSKRDRLWLFGGTGTATYDDLWYWTPSTREWTLVTVSGMRPTARYGTWMFYNAALDKMYLFGQNGGGYQNWEYDPALNTWKDRTVTSPPTGVSRSYYEVTFDSDRGKIVMLGGSGPNGYNTDIWEWDTTTYAWTQLMPATSSPIPDGRYYHAIAYDSIRRLIVLVGGYKSVTGFTGPSNDSWEWDANLLKWNETTPVGVKPAPRYNHVMAFNSVRGTTYLFGGTVNDDPTYGPGEFWEYIPNATARDNGAGCTTATASNCKSGNCVDGVCCAQTAAQCNGTCKSCNVPGSAGTCANVLPGSPDDTCPSDLACDSSQQCKALLGHACTSFSECASGQCTDGVCCNTACNGTCQVCNLAAKRGTCSPVPKDIEDPPTCVSDDVTPRACDGTGTCGAGKRAAGKPCTAGVQCQSTYCVDGFCCGSACNTACYTCGKAGSEGSCTYIAVGYPDHSATTPCDSPNQSCNGSGTCSTAKKPNGAACPGGASDCASNFCVDQVCCNNACLGTCMACDVAGNEGTCAFAAAGRQDLNATMPCMGANYCDGTGVCASGLKPNGSTCAAGTECGSTFCADGVCCEQSCTAACYTCATSGNGKCVGVIAGATDSNATTKCESPNYCTALHECTAGLKPNGATCVNDTDCGSAHCVDKVCCETACSGGSNTCRVCNSPTALGKCVYAAAGSDAHNECAGEMGCGGKCDGQGACAWAPATKSCRQAGCQTDLGQITKAATCDGAGKCPAELDMNKDCMGFGCFIDTGGQSVCKTDCRTDPECAIRRYCDIVSADSGVDGATVSSCPAQFILGHACSRDTQCLSGNCAIQLGQTVGVCCNTDCNHCGTCDSTGTCIPDPAGTKSPTCMDSQSDPTGKCGGVCDGHAHCMYPKSGTACGLCKTCDGVGLCNQMPQDDDACGTIECGGRDTMCMTYQDLTTNRCKSPGVCKKDNTADCTVFTNTCTGTGGAGGTGGGTGGGGATGSAGNPGGGRGGGSAGSTGTGSGGSSTTGTAGKDGGAGSGGGGGGGCGCALGGSQSASSLGALLVLASVMMRRRRRR